MKVRIWTVNRCTELLAHDDDEIQAIFQPAGVEVTFGTRQGMGYESARQLMPESEYFVPIPLKCIGDRYLRDKSNPLLKNITDSYKYFDEDVFRSWWEPDAAKNITKHELPDSFKPRMQTPKYQGYYDLLDGDAKHILVGYSEGGLVARYLAFLDEYVFKENKIIAVLTVSAPNYGSPLGDPVNKESVTAGLLEIVLSLSSFHGDRFPQLYAEIGKTAKFENYYSALVAAQKDAEQGPQHDAQPIIETAVKWLSGLHGDPNSAFAEIDARNLGADHPFSVLRLINSEQYKAKAIYTGGVISANADLSDLVRSLVIGGRAASLGKRILQEAEEIALHAIMNIRLFGIPLRSNEAEAGLLYSHKVMSEQTDEPPELEALKKKYVADVAVEKPLSKTGTIPRFSHDYIIPSVYQILPSSPRLLGHYVNRSANHNSGKGPDLDAGAENVQALHLLFKRLATALGEKTKEAAQG
jgi:hypothetical protein